jgi:NTP pyrophosphatase (non-canonical NTP hydrolase)
MAEGTTVNSLQEKALRFRDERNWKQYHDPKNLAEALSIEAGELLELFLWKSKKEVQELVRSKTGKSRIREETADIFIYLLFITDSVGVDLSDAVLEKLKINRKKYPVEKSRSSSRKYTEL